MKKSRKHKNKLITKIDKNADNSYVKVRESEPVKNLETRTQKNIVQSLKIFSRNKYLPLAVILIVLGVSIAGIGKYKLNLGSDFASKTVLQITVDQPLTVAQMWEYAGKVKMPERIEQTGTKGFSLYFANLNADDRQKILDDLAQYQQKYKVNVTEKNFYISEPPIFYQIKSRVISTVAISFGAYILYLAISLRKLQLSRKNALILLAGDLILLLLAITALLGVASYSGNFGLPMDDWFFSSLLLSSILLIIYRIYIFLRLRDYLQTTGSGNETLGDIWKKLLSDNWQPLFLLNFIMGVLVILPMSVFSKPMLFSFIFPVTAILLMAMDMLFLRKYILELLSRLNILNKYKLLEKIW